ncbi:cytochrome c peroxidase [Planktotalea sp.]|uniref:cytochrome-c peroxidase n=1 Tax=Planktotalea sp. TaxID=2029877 RepID=UPI003296B5DF
MIKPLSALRALLLCLASVTAAQAEVLLSEEEIAQTLAHGPWPPAFEPDASNRVSGDADAIAFGQVLFFDPILSRNGDMSCASCHDPEHGFAESRPRAVGQVLLDRNTLSLMNLSAHRWFGWAGDTDSIWAQSITPLLNPDEMGHDAGSLKTALMQSDQAQEYSDIFGPISEQDSEEVLVNTSKALAAYQETLVTGQTSFDLFRDALEQGDLERAALYPEGAQRGLQTFIGRGNCAFCHSGPSFSNGEFHDVGVPYFVTETRVDQGRFGGMQALKASPYNLAGRYSDDPDKRGAWAVENVRMSHGDFGIFRVPSLRGTAHTAPYMHDGSLPDLRAVVQHYNEIDLERLHADGEAILMPLGLTEGEIGDLIQFLNSLSDD